MLSHNWLCVTAIPCASACLAVPTGMADAYILGISAFYHDSAACLLRNGEIVAAAQEERFTRKKGDASFPIQAVEYCLRSAGIGAADLAFVGFYDKPPLKVERLLPTHLDIPPPGFPSFVKTPPLWLRGRMYTHRPFHDAP